MSIPLFHAICCTAPLHDPKKQRQRLPLALSSVSARARLAVEKMPRGLCFGTARAGSIAVRVGPSRKGELRLPTGAPLPDWQGKELGYPPRHIFLRQVSVRKLCVPWCLDWWLVRCRTREPVPLTVVLEQPPGPVSLPDPAFVDDLVALWVDGTGLDDAIVGDGVLLDCEAQLKALRHARAITLLGRTQRWFPHLPALAQLPALRVLTLGLADLHGWKWMAQCRALRVLQLSGCLSRLSLTPVTHLRGLHIVSLEACDVREVAPLAALPNLRVLRVRFASFLSDLGVVGRLPHLEVLDASDNVRLRSVAGLGGAPRLRWLSLRGAPVSDISAVAALPSLRYLDCSACDNLVRLPALGAIPYLDEVDLTRSAVANLDGFSGSESVRRLVAAHCYNLVSLSGLRAATALEELDVSHTPITSLDALAGATRLRTLFAHSTAIRDFDGLAECCRLETLDAHNCRALVTVAALSGLKTLRVVDLRQCSGAEDWETLTPPLSRIPKTARILRSSNTA